MDLVLRTIVVFVLILVVTRAVGRRELSSMEPFDLILLVVMGDLVQSGITQSDYSLTGTAIVIFTMAVLVVLTGWLSFRFVRLRPLLEGEPTLLIADGDLLKHNLRRERMTVEELRAEARQQSIGSLRRSSGPCSRPTGRSASSPRRRDVLDDVRPRSARRRRRAASPSSAATAHAPARAVARAGQQRRRVAARPAAGTAGRSS